MKTKNARKRPGGKLGGRDGEIKRRGWSLRMEPRAKTTMRETTTTWMKTGMTTNLQMMSPTMS